MNRSDSNSQHTPKVLLVGGLGNQLFQTVAGLFLSNSEKVLLDTSFGKPALNSQGVPIIFDLKMSSVIETAQSRRINICQRAAFNISLRISPKLVSHNAAKVIAKTIEYLLKKIIPGASHVCYEGIETDHMKSEKLSDATFVGYFQTLNFTSIARDKDFLPLFDLRTESDWIRELTKIAKVEKPLVVHMRFGDYSKSSILDSPSPEYFKNSLDEMWQSGKYKKIWFFSDDITRAKTVVQSRYNKMSRWIDGDGKSPAEVLQVMRLGAGYVISNSTFGWWGAILSRCENAEVIYPIPWLSDGLTIREIALPHWEPRQRKQ